MGSNGWSKLDDKAWSHHKMIRAGEALALWSMALSWASFNNTDKLPKGPALIGVFPSPFIDHATMAAKLVEVGLWVEEEDCYRIHEFRAYNPTREQRDEEQRAKDRERKRRQRAREKAERDACDEGRDGADVTRDEHDSHGTGRDGLPKSRRDPGRAPCSLSPDPCPSPGGEGGDARARDPAPPSEPPPGTERWVEHVLEAQLLQLVDPETGDRRGTVLQRDAPLPTREAVLAAVGPRLWQLQAKADKVKPDALVSACEDMLAMTPAQFRWGRAEASNVLRFLEKLFTTRNAHEVERPAQTRAPPSASRREQARRQFKYAGGDA